MHFTRVQHDVHVQLSYEGIVSQSGQTFPCLVTKKRLKMFRTVDPKSKSDVIVRMSMFPLQLTSGQHCGCVWFGSFNAPVVQSDRDYLRQIFFPQPEVKKKSNYSLKCFDPLRLLYCSVMPRLHFHLLSLSWWTYIMGLSSSHVPNLLELTLDIFFRGMNRFKVKDGLDSKLKQQREVKAESETWAPGTSLFPSK